MGDFSKELQQQRRQVNTVFQILTVNWTRVSVNTNDIYIIICYDENVNQALVNWGANSNDHLGCGFDFACSLSLFWLFKNITLSSNVIALKNHVFSTNWLPIV